VALLRREGGVELIQSHGPILGVLPGAGWGSERLSLRPGDALAFYSDGILESLDPEDNELGTEGIAAALKPLAGCAPAEIAEGLLRAAERHRRGGEAQDDVTLLVVRYRGPSSKTLEPIRGDRNPSPNASERI
jgi:sigma-B regulation protein RsbU (phosphoserine phosphatase)